MTLGTAFLALASSRLLVTALVAKESVHLLQRRGLARGRPTPSPELQRALPIAWVHIPKSGSSFLNTLIHLPGVCPDLPEDLVVNRTTFNDTFLAGFRGTYNLTTVCPGLLEGDGNRADHSGIEDRWSDVAKARGHMMVMLRRPEQRLISAYFNMQLAAHRPRILNRKCESWGGWPNASLPSIPQFARQNRGCATRMLTRPGCPCGGWEGPVTGREMAEAKRTLREDFTFVGITDRWTLSMCLFSSMFKVPCHGSQFMDSRLSWMKKYPKDRYPLNLLGGVTDPYDGELYEEALKIFGENLRRYNVTESSCKQCLAESASTLFSTSSRESQA